MSCPVPLALLRYKPKFPFWLEVKKILLGRMRSRLVIATYGLCVSGLLGGRLPFGGVVIYQILHFLTGLEIRNALGRNFHARARFRITPNARLPSARAEASKTPDLDLIPAAYSPHHTVENSLDDHL